MTKAHKKANNCKSFEFWKICKKQKNYSNLSLIILTSIVLTSLLVSNTCRSQAQIFLIEEKSLQKFYKIDSDTGEKSLLLQDTISNPGNIQYYKSKIYYTEGQNIKIINDNGTEFNNLIERNFFIRTIKIDKNKELIYWVESASDGSYIYSSNLNGSNIKLLYKYLSNVESIFSIDINELNSLIYFSTNSKIFRLELDMQSVTQIVSGYSDIKRIRIDAADNRLFWLDSFIDKIYSSSLNGTDVSTIYSRGFGEEVTDIFVDFKNNIIHWFDSRNFIIGSVDYQAKKLQPLMNLGDGNDLNGFYSVFYDFDQEKLYWTYSGGQIKSKNKNSSQSIVIFKDSYKTVQEMWADDMSKQVYLRHDGIWSINVNGGNYKQIVDIGDNYLFPHVVNGYIYYWNPLNQVKRVKIDGGNSELITDKFQGATSMYVDYEKDKIYFSNFSCKCIRSFTISTSALQLLYVGTNVDEINYDKEDNFLFWVDDKSNTREILSRGANNQNKVIFKTSDKIGSVSLDKVLNRIYWTQSSGEMGTLYSSKYDGTDIRKISTISSSIRAISVLSSLGSNTKDLSTQFKIYPNPASDFIKIEVDNLLNYQVNIIDLIGNRIKSEINTFLLQVNDIQSGIYLIQIKDLTTGKEMIEKVIIQN